MRSGFAVADRGQSTDYVEAEKDARRAQNGIWSGEAIITPAEWRKGKR